MSQNEFPPRPEQGDDAGDLSATGMFLRSFDSGSPAQAQPPAATPPAQAAAPAPPPASKPSGPGEFTQMFQALNAQPPAQPSAPPAPHAPSSPIQSIPVQSHPVQSIPIPSVHPVTPAPPPAAGSGQGEFTRVFVSGNTPVPPPAPQQARTVIEQAPPQSAAPRNKGFSTPGVSGSASGEGSFTQLFNATPSARSAPAPAPAAPQYSAPAPPPYQEPPRAAAPPPPSSGPVDAGSATGMLSSFGSQGAGSQGSGSQPFSSAPPPAPYRHEPMPSYTPAPPPAEPAPLEAGSVTRLIQRLGQVQPQAPPEQVYTPPPVAAAPSPASSGPGEFTRMISGESFRTGNAAPPPPPAPAPPAIAVNVTMPPIQAPHLPPMPAAPAMPHFQVPAMPPPAAAPAPHMAMPAAPAMPAMPTMPAMAISAPPAKLPPWIPILVIVDTFLIVVMLVVMIFSMVKH